MDVSLYGIIYDKLLNMSYMYVLLILLLIFDRDIQGVYP